jgi:sugar/nucleoside kinase (ribokinase family)
LSAFNFILICFINCFKFLEDILACDVKELPGWGQDSLASSIQLIPGGSAFNIVAHGANYSHHLSKNITFNFVSVVGEDQHGMICKQAIINTPSVIDNVIIKSGNRTGSCIVISNKYDRCFVTDRGVVDEMRIDWFEEDSIFPENTSHLHFAGN